MPNFDPDLSFIDEFNASIVDADQRWISNLDPPEDASWALNDGKFEYYNLPYFPEVGDLKTVITQAQIKDGTGIDIAGGSNGVALRDLMELGVLSKALVTNFEDRRTPDVKVDTRLDRVDGNVLESGTWRRILGWAKMHAPSGVDLILHRPQGALQALAPEVYRHAARTVIDLLAPNGILFAQIPPKIVGTEGHTVDYLRGQPGVADAFFSPTNPHIIVVKDGAEQS